MKVSFVGASRAGISVAAYMKSKGFEVTGFFSRELAWAVDAAVAVDCKAFDELEKALRTAELIFISTSDDNIRKTMHKIRMLKPENKIFCCLSGVEGAEILDIGEANTYFSFHPPYLFDTKVPVNLDGLTFILEGYGKRYWDFIDEVDERCIPYIEVKPGQKAVYHFALCFMTSFVSDLLMMGNEVLKTSGVGRMEMFAPIIRWNVSRMLEADDMVTMLTGPAARGDVATLRKHLEAMRHGVGFNIQSIYKMIALSELEYSDVTDAVRKRIKELLLMSGVDQKD